MIIKCENCSRKFERPLSEINRNIRENRLSFCSNKCNNEYRTKKGVIFVKCINCNKIVKRTLSQFKRTKNSFCNSSCSATYNNCRKKYGTKRSKLEKYLEINLVEIYPSLVFHFNRSDAINSELDIYIPTLKLAFELNGIFHYEPIFGDEKLKQIQNNDNRKFQACLEQGIELCIIDTSQQKYFKKTTSQKYLNIIRSIIDKKLKMQ